MISQDRLMVLDAVINGQISTDYVTLAELNEYSVQTQELIMEKLMDKAMDRGCTVFSEVEYGMLN